MTRYLRHVALLISALLFIALRFVSAQVSTGTITGYVHDSSDAAIVGAKVSIVQLAPWANQNRVARAVVGGWQLNGIFTKQSGFPTDIRSALVAATNQLFATFNVPDRVPGQSIYLPNGGPEGWFNAAAFSQPTQVVNAKGTPLTRFGNSARRVGRGPGTTNLDFSVFRNFAIRERFNLQFRAEAFNLSNTPAFSCPAQQVRRSRSAIQPSGSSRRLMLPDGSFSSD